MEKTRRFTFLRGFLALIILVLCSFLSITFWNRGQFYESLNAFSGAVSRGDQLAARDNLSNLEYFYHLPNLKGFAGRSLFKYSANYQASYDFLTGNHERVISNDLKDKDDYWALFIRSNSVWRNAKKLNEQALEETDPKLKQEKQKQALEMAASTKDDYCQAVRIDPTSSLPPKWNCDLVSDPAAMANALMPKPAKVKLRLGEGGNKGNNPGNLDGEAPGKGTLNLDKKNGNKPALSNKPGSGKEG